MAQILPPPNVAACETAALHPSGRPKGSIAMTTDTFHAYDDAGNRYTIHVRRTYIDTRGADGLGRRVESLRTYYLNDGGPVDRLDDDTFAIVDTGVGLRLTRSAA
jgi:hypothetical protein